MPRLVVIGRRWDILPFRAAGAEVKEVADAAGARAALEEMTGEKQPCLVMMTEDFSRECAEQVARFRAGKFHAILAVPSLHSPPGGQRDRVRALIARAVGVDLLGRGKENEQASPGPPLGPR